MSDKPQFKIRLSHIIAILISTAMWAVLIFFLTACLQPVVTSAPTQTGARDLVGTAGADVPRISDRYASEPELIILFKAAPTMRTVCAKTLYVRGAPSTASTPIRYLSRGEVVKIHEWDKRGTGWAMIAPAEWINADFLCKE